MKICLLPKLGENEIDAETGALTSAYTRNTFDTSYISWLFPNAKHILPTLAGCLKTQNAHVNASANANTQAEYGTDVAIVTRTLNPAQTQIKET